jgi:predicted PurR-regulated permease PerM
MPEDQGHSGAERTLRLRLTWGATLPLAAALAIAVGGLSILRMSARPLGLLIIAITVAEALEPLITRLERRMRRPLAVGVVILGLAACAALAAWLVVPSVIDQGEGLVARLPQMVASVQEWLRQADVASHGEVSRVISSGASDATHQLVAIPGQLLSMLTDVFVVAFLALYWMAGSPSMREFLLSLVPGHRRDRLRRLLHNVGQAMGGYVRGAAINAVIMGVLAAIGLSIIGVNDPLALGVITALGEPFPYVGPIAAAVPVVLVALVQSPTKVLRSSSAPPWVASSGSSSRSPCRLVSAFSRSR